MRQPILELANLQRTFRQGPRTIEVLKGTGASLMPGEAVALVGPSGAGKSSLLHIAGLLERPDAGSVVLDGVDCVQLSDGDRTRLRRRDIGFVYQFHHLLPEFSALENITMPQRILGRSRHEANQRAEELLAGLGLADRGHHRPAELSGGEQQRVAIARALANEPHVLLADEPTGNLDPETAERVFQQLMTLIHTTGVAALIATHNLELAHRMDRVFQLSGGHIHELARPTQAAAQ